MVLQTIGAGVSTLATVAVADTAIRATRRIGQPRRKRMRKSARRDFTSFL